MLLTSYTPLITENSSFSLILSKQLLHRMSLNTHVTRAQKSIEVWPHKWNVREIQPERSLWEFCVLRHPNHFLLAGTQHSSALKHYHYPTIPRSPCSSKLRFSVAYWQQLHFPLCTCKLLHVGCFLGILPSGAIMMSSPGFELVPQKSTFLILISASEN